MLNYTFDWGSEGMVYADDLFNGTQIPENAALGISNGILSVLLGEGPTKDAGPMSGGWFTNVNLTETSTATVTFDYQASHPGSLESNEVCEVLFSLNGQLIGVGGASYVDQLVPPNGNVSQSTGWQTVTLDLGTLNAGMHQLAMGGQMAWRSAYDEYFLLEFDNFRFDISPTGGGSADPEPTPGLSTVALGFGDDVFKFGNSADDTSGGLGNDKLTGAGGDDMLFGAEGQDILSGGNHNDTLAGGSGNDVLRGGNGDDILWGGAGQDILHGDGAAGGGADIFCFSTNSMGSFDIIKDFDVADGDRLDLSHVLIGFDPATDTVRDFVKFQDLGLRTIVRVDVDGAGGNPGFVKVAVLHGVTGLASEDQLFQDGTLIL